MPANAASPDTQSDQARNQSPSALPAKAEYAVLPFCFLRDWVLTSSSEKLHDFLDALYFSAPTFTTLGFGDYAPSGSSWVKLLVVSEAALGAVMIGLAMVTFARKAIRD